jgi:hypothetical protein
VLAFKQFYCILLCNVLKGKHLKQTSTPTSLTSVGRSVGIVCSRTQATEFRFCLIHQRNYEVCNNITRIFNLNKDFGTSK